MSATGEVIRDVSVVAGASVGGSLLAKAVGAVVVGVPPRHSAFRTHCKRAIRTRDTRFTGKKAGEFYEVVGPGNYLSVGLRAYRQVSEQAVVNNLEDFNIRDGTEQITVRSIAQWGVVIDPRTGQMDHEAGYRFAYNSKDEEALVVGVLGICGSGLRKVVSELENPQDIYSKQAYSLVAKECGAELREDFGVELRALRVLESAEDIVSAIKNASPGFDFAKMIAGAFGSENGGSVPVENGNGNGAHAVQSQAI